MNKLTYAAAYVRVSTEEQTEYSPDAQIRAINDYCAKNNMLLSKEHIFVDEGISGRSAAKRPEFQKMIALAKSKEKPFDAIVVHKFDRFARSREDSVVYKSLLRKDCGVKVLSVTESIDDDKFSIILEAMLEAMAEYYSINLSEEVKKGMTEKALRGEPLTIAPFGYKIENKRLIIEEDEAEIVKGIFIDFIAGMSIFSIVKGINLADIKTKRGKQFENRTVEYILQNPVYVGKIRWNPKGRTRRNYKHPDLMITLGIHEPIIDLKTWETAQQKMEQQKAHYTKYSKADSASHWLIGLLKCGRCGTGLVKNGKMYFQCRSYVGGKCTVSHLLNIIQAEQAIIERLKADSKSAEPLSTISQGKSADNGSMLKRQIAATMKRLERVKEAFAAGVDTLEEYAQNKEKLSAELAQLRAQETQKETESIVVDYDKLKQSIKAAVIDLENENKSIEDKKQIVKTFIDHIVFSKAEQALYIVYKTI